MNECTFVLEHVLQKRCLALSPKALLVFCFVVYFSCLSMFSGSFLSSTGLWSVLDENDPEKTEAHRGEKLTELSRRSPETNKSREVKGKKTAEGVKGTSFILTRDTISGSIVRIEHRKALRVSSMRIWLILGNRNFAPSPNRGLWSLFLKQEEGEWGEGVECKRVRGWWGLGRNGDFLKESAPHERILSLS